MKYLAPFLLLFWIVPLAAVGQVRSSDEVGLPFFWEHYTSRDYQAKLQNWWVVQDRRGVIYVANNDGVLQYDGAGWRLIRTHTVVRSLAVDAAGIVYVGLQGDFGYLAPDATGTLRFVSLLEQVEAPHLDFGDVWSTHATTDGVFFLTRERLFRWDGSGMHVWQTDNVFHTSFAVHDRLYVREHSVGLLAAVGDTLQLIPGGEVFAREPAYMMAPYDAARMLIGTRSQGFFLYDGTGLTPFKTVADDFVYANKLYHGCALPGGRFALATLGAGVVVLNRHGELDQVLNTAGGLPDDYVNFVYPDRQGGLWMALNNKGIVRADVTQLTVFSDELGLDGTIQAMYRHEGTLYVGTATGLYYLKRQPLALSGAPERPAFVQVPGIGSTRSLVSVGRILYAGTYRGIYPVVEGRAVTRITDQHARVLHPSQHKAGVIYAGIQRNAEKGLAILQVSESGVLEQQQLILLDHEVTSIAEEEDGTLWLATLNGDVLRLDPAAREEATVEHFTPEVGPAGGYILAFIGPDGAVRISARSGIYAFRETAGGQGRFLLDTLLTPPAVAARDTLLSVFSEGDSRRLWIVYQDRVEVAARRPNGTYLRQGLDVLRFDRLASPQVHVEPGGVAWLSDGPRLVRYDPGLESTFDAPFVTLVRRIATVKGPTVFGGALDARLGNLALLQASSSLPRIPYGDNDLHIEYAAATFNLPAQTRYQYFLEGWDPGWSPWTLETSQTYPNLPEGTYRFRVRARNAQGIVSQETIFVFQVLAPWYRTWWAYLLYCSFLLTVGVLIYHYRRIVQENRRALEQARELARERVVNERLQQANQRLHEANESLVQADKLKDELLANTSHELRTPITAILGFSTILREELDGPHREFLDIIEDNGKRLLHTVNALLDVAKLRAGVVDLFHSDVAIGEHTGGVVKLLSPLAQEKRLRLEFIPPAPECYAWLDSSYLERILYNLLGNAIKFTDQGGVTVEAGREDGHVFVRIRDTGIGIDEGFLPFLFDEFMQESTGLTRSHEGNGLGLSITARLVRLMEGEIEVESVKGEGSIFTVRFPALDPAEAPEEGADAAYAGEAVIS